MRKFITVIGLAAVIMAGSVINTKAQTTTGDTNTSVLPPEVNKILSFAGSASNLMAAVYGISSTDAKTFGGGVCLAYKLSDMIVPTVRLDWYNRQLWMPSANIQLQAPITLFGKVTAVPFAFAGVAEALGGSSSGVSSGTVVGMFGAGLAVRVSSRVDLVADYEKWTGFSSDQVRFGVLYKF